MSLEAKREALYAILRRLQRIAIALSGGVDSSYLLAAAVDAVGAGSVLALTADSPLFPRFELETARETAALLGVTHEVLPFDDLANPQVAANPTDRCYHCKRARFEALLPRAAAWNGATLVHGENIDDLGVYRPGSAAAKELGVQAPLAEAGLTKAEIRQLARARGLSNWDTPSAACLATRFPYDTPLTREGLARVEQAERVVRAALGDVQLRVRDHLPIARVEIAPDAGERLLSDAQARRRMVAEFKALGYRYVTLDLEGYRSGSYDDRIEA